MNAITKLPLEKSAMRNTYGKTPISTGCRRYYLRIATDCLRALPRAIYGIATVCLRRNLHTYIATGIYITRSVGTKAGGVAND